MGKMDGRNRLKEKQSLLLAQGDQFLQFPERRCEGLLTDDMLAVLKRPLHVIVMQTVRRSHIDRIIVPVLHHSIHIRKSHAYLEFIRKQTGLLLCPRINTVAFRTFHLPHCIQKAFDYEPCTDRCYFHIPTPLFCGFSYSILPQKSFKRSFD